MEPSAPPSDRLQGSPSPASFRRILLVGFMGSGKSTVGPLLARELGWRFVDLDTAVEREAGRTISHIFREEGEEAFRAVEDRMARRLLGEDLIVLASGGGWPCRPGRMEALPENTLSIWLAVPPELALERARGQGTERPLLDVPDPLRRTRELLVRREPYYRAAHWWVDTERRTPPEVVGRVVDHLRTEPERPLRA